MRPLDTVYTGMIQPGDPRMPGPQKAMLDATPDCIKMLSVDGRLLMLNRAGRLALNIPEDSPYGMPWLPLLSEDVHAAGQAALDKAVAGENARFPGKSPSPDGPVFWDNLLVPLKDNDGVVLSILCVSRDVTETVKLERQLEAVVERERLLAQEMQHRIKNLFSVVSGLIHIAEREARADEDAGSATAIIRSKLDALARASDAIFARDAVGAETGPGSLESVARAVLKPYGDQCGLSGCPVSIRSESATSLALFLHELATNSVKYGALSVAEGTVALRWKAGEEALEVSWTETGGPPVSAPPARCGFGSQMVDRIIQASGGSITRRWEAEGLAVELRLPSTFYG